MSFRLVLSWMMKLNFEIFGPKIVQTALDYRYRQPKLLSLHKRALGYSSMTTRHIVPNSTWLLFTADWAQSASFNRPRLLSVSGMTVGNWCAYLTTVNLGARSAGLKFHLLATLGVLRSLIINQLSSLTLVTLKFHFPIASSSALEYHYLYVLYFVKSHFSCLQMSPCAVIHLPSCYFMFSYY